MITEIKECLLSGKVIQINLIVGLLCKNRVVRKMVRYILLLYYR